MHVDAIRFFAQQVGARRPRRIQITALDAVLDELLGDTHGLEVHAEDRRNLRGALAEMILTFDLVQDRMHLERVVTLDVDEAVGPGGQIGVRVGTGSAVDVVGRADAGQPDDVGVDLGTIEIVENAGSVAAGHG